MNTKTTYKAIIIASAVIFLTGCTDLFTNPNNSTATASSSISVNISSPKTDDTIAYKGTTINYSVVKNAGIHAVELYVNGVINNWVPANSDGSQPTIALTLDSSYIGKRISYYLIYYDTYNTNNLSARSDTMKNILITDVSKVPYSPYGFTINVLNSSVINLSWKDSTSAGSPGYEIWRKRGYYGQFSLYLTASPNTYNINDADAADTTVYYYKIRGLDSYGTSAFSAEINSYGDGATRSIAPPTELKATSSSATVVKLTWTNDIGSVNYYRIERRYPWTNYVSVGIAVGNVTSYADSANGLTGSATYYYRVKAIAGSDSSWSNEALVTTPWQ